MHRRTFSVVSKHEHVRGLLRPFLGVRGTAWFAIWRGFVALKVSEFFLVDFPMYFVVNHMI